MTVATAHQQDFRPASMFASQKDFANAAFAELNSRLAPAKLANNELNGTHVSAWLNQNARDVAPKTVA